MTCIHYHEKLNESIVYDPMQTRLANRKKATEAQGSRTWCTNYRKAPEKHIMHDVLDQSKIHNGQRRLRLQNEKADGQNFTNQTLAATRLRSSARQEQEIFKMPKIKYPENCRVRDGLSEMHPQLL